MLESFCAENKRDFLNYEACKKKKKTRTQNFLETEFSLICGQRGGAQNPILQRKRRNHSLVSWGRRTLDRSSGEKRGLPGEAVWHETLVVSFVTWLSRGCGRGSSRSSTPSTDRIKLSFHGSNEKNRRRGSRPRCHVLNDICSTDLTIVDFFFNDRSRKAGSEETKREDYFYQERHTTNMNYPF